MHSQSNLLDFTTLCRRVLLGFWQNTDNVKFLIVKITITILSQMIYRTTCTTFWLICARPFSKLSKLNFNHQWHNASIYLTSTCLQRVDFEIILAASSVSLGKHCLHCITVHKYDQGFTSFPSSSTSAD